MSWAYAIAGTVAVVGAYLSSEDADADRDAAERANQTELGFQQERYDDWKEIYGDIQANLSDYYTNLSADQYEVAGLEAIEKEKALSLTNIRETLSQRGITDSGLSAAAEIGIEMQTAQDRAAMRQAAPGLVAQEQLSFLQVGLGQDPSQSLANTLGQQAADRRADAAASSAAAGAAVGSAITTIGTGLSDYLTDDGDD